MENNATPSKTRHLWIDLAKALSITFVVYRHCPPKDFEPISSIPFFFFMSGLLFTFEKYPSFTSFIKHRSKQLLVPYFCFFTLFYLFWLFIGRNMSSPEEQELPLYAPIIEYLYGRPVSVCMPLWFVACLFAMQCIFYIFKNLNRNVVTLILFLLPFLPCLVDMSNLPWMLDNVCYYFPFYGISCLYKREIFLFIKNGKRYLFCLIFLAICILSSWLLKDVYRENVKIALKMIQSFSIILPLIVLIKKITDKFGVHHLINYIVTNAIIILAFHTYAVRLLDVFITHILNYGPDFYDGNFLLKLCMTIFVIITMFAPIYVINKYFPFILGKGRLFE